MALPEDFKEALKARVKIEDVVSPYTTLKRRGRTLVGLCPFHSEKTPSFTVYPDNGSFYCFGCGAGGDVISFVERAENLDYMEAVRSLAQRVGLTVPESEADRGLAKLRMRLYEANRAAARFYHQCLLSPEGAPAMEYLTRRGLTQKTIRHFGLGYAPGKNALTRHLKGLGFTPRELELANLCFQGRSGYPVDRFRDRVIYPILDLRGNVIAFGGRILGDGEPKYLNTSDTPVFSKGSNLFALNFAKNVHAENLILCEGYMDVIALHQAGFENAVAGLGTALTPDQARLLGRYTKEVVASYDADAAGQKAASRSIPLLRAAGLNVRVLVVPDGKDPDEFLRAHGKNAHAEFQLLLDHCGNDVAYQLDKARSRQNIQTPEGKVAYLEAAAGILASLDSEIEREIYAGKLAEECDVQRAAVLQQVNAIRAKQVRTANKKAFRTFRQQTAGIRDSVNPDKSQNLRAARAEEALLGILLDYPENAAYIFDQLPPEKWITAFNRRVYSLIAGKMKDGKGMSLTDLHGVLSQEELSKVAGYCARRSGFPADRAEIDSYVRVLQAENDKQCVQGGSQEEILRYMESLRAQKK